MYIVAQYDKYNIIQNSHTCLLIQSYFTWRGLLIANQAQLVCVFFFSIYWYLKLKTLQHFTCNKANCNISSGLASSSSPLSLFVCAQWCWLCALTGAFTYSCMTAKVAPSNGTDVSCHLPSGLFLILCLPCWLLKWSSVFFLSPPTFPEEIQPTKLGIRGSETNDLSVCLVSYHNPATVFHLFTHHPVYFRLKWG